MTLMITKGGRRKAEGGRVARSAFPLPPSAFAIAVTLGLLFGAAPSFILAADLSSPDAAVEAGREALGDQWDLNWYDAKADDFRAIEQKPPKDYDWSWLDWLWDFFTGWSFDLAGLIKALLWLMVIALVAILVVAMLRAIQQAELRDAQATSQEEEDARSHIERVEALPVAVERRLDDLLAEARRLHAAGDPTLAIVYLFSHELIELDRAHLIRLVKGKTNRQYLRELRRSAPDRPRLAEILGETTLVFERAFFGAHPPTREKLDACFAAVEEFESLTRVEVS